VSGGDEKTDVVVVVTTWECQTCKTDAPKGKPCPKCGRKLLVD